VISLFSENSNIQIWSERNKWRGHLPVIAVTGITPPSEQFVATKWNFVIPVTITCQLTVLVIQFSSLSDQLLHRLWNIKSDFTHAPLRKTSSNWQWLWAMSNSNKMIITVVSLIHTRWCAVSKIIAMFMISWSLIKVVIIVNMNLWLMLYHIKYTSIGTVLCSWDITFKATESTVTVASQ